MLANADRLSPWERLFGSEKHGLRQERCRAPDVPPLRSVSIVPIVPLGRSLQHGKHSLESGIGSDLELFLPRDFAHLAGQFFVNFSPVTDSVDTDDPRFTIQLVNDPKSSDFVFP